jgi:hypothetical protein
MDRVIHTRWNHADRQSVLLTVLDTSLVVIVTLFALWAVFVLVMLLHGATKAGA